MGTLTAGIKEIFSSAKTSGSNVMLCGNDGTPDGHITMANLANALGALWNLRYAEIAVPANGSGSLSNCKRYGLYFVFENATQGAWGIFGVLGGELVKVSASKYGTSNASELFTLSFTDTTTLTISTLSPTPTSHKVLYFAGD